jgi:hypothetical protein
MSWLLMSLHLSHATPAAASPSEQLLLQDITLSIHTDIVRALLSTACSVGVVDTASVSSSSSSTSTSVQIQAIERLDALFDVLMGEMDRLRKNVEGKEELTPVMQMPRAAAAFAACAALLHALVAHFTLIEAKHKQMTKESKSSTSGAGGSNGGKGGNDSKEKESKFTIPSFCLKYVEKFETLLVSSLLPYVTAESKVTGDTTTPALPNDDGDDDTNDDDTNNVTSSSSSMNGSEGSVVGGVLQCMGATIAWHRLLCSPLRLTRRDEKAVMAASMPHVGAAVNQAALVLSRPPTTTSGEGKSVSWISTREWEQEQCRSIDLLQAVCSSFRRFHPRLSR